MKITTFNPLIVTKNPEPTIKMFEEMGFERHHTKKEIGENKTTDVRMKHPSGFYVDVAWGENEYTLIRINVDNFDEAIEFFLAHGCRRPKNEQAKKTVDTGSSKFTILVGPSGYLLDISQHIKDHN